MASFKEEVLKASAQYPKPEGQVFQYGTAGFRMNASLLGSVVFRVGLLAAVRSKKINATVGVMITASHNPAIDNGVKVVDSFGEMLEASWEKWATNLANAATDADLVAALDTVIKETNTHANAKARVVYARDTRESGPALVLALKAGLGAMGAESTDYGLMTTPQLHYVTRCINTKGSPYEYGEPTEQGYYEKLAAAFKMASKGGKFKDAVTVDCANGVGGPKLRELIKYLPTAAEGGIDIKVVNDDVEHPDRLNHMCGADFVKTKQAAPPSAHAAKLARCCSLDGDADRIVYYFIGGDDMFHLLDGDRIATLVAAFIGELSRAAGLGEKIQVGCVQTAYANGASTEYLEKNLKLPVVCTNTGVKYLHHAAMRFDTGIYWEANGHGTSLFSEKTLLRIAKHQPQSPAQADNLNILKALTHLINQTVGDALSDLLLVEVILARKGWGPQQWINNYHDLPNRLVRVEVRDRGIFKAVDAERKLESPAGLQAQIDSLVGKYQSGRSFARASGTEDAVRVYAEAATRAEADDLASKVAGLVKEAGI